MTTYGTIPTERLPSSNLDIVSQAKGQIELCLGIQRPWLEMIQLQDLKPPSSFNQSIQRIRTNVAFFRMNYAIIILTILFISLLWHPISLMIFIVTMAAWLFLYYLHDKPLVVVGYEIDQRFLMAALFLVTALILFLTNVKYNIIMALSIGLAFVLVHGALREPEDVMTVDDEERLASGGGPVLKVPLKIAASSSYSLSQ
ncbi:putative prenylated rab acceptor PRA1 [Rosa chinensis]|uniref:PRA1 family protein n=1 Tax=Rosa chinensis TaxID=74649 RepID=A0A2P6RKA2_ROSCH|nr:PRA1 family protein F3 [Rosa chinensis]PRQ46821.1 putative prenylated rab acceptor PRA1 [Rosa chinensis]